MRGLDYSHLEPSRSLLGAFWEPSSRWGLDYSHSLAVADDGAVFSWGAGKDVAAWARLGAFSEPSRRFPGAVP